MSLSTPSTVYHSDTSSDDTTWRPKLADINHWLQEEWSALEKKFNANALGSVHDFMNKAPALLTKFDELNELKRLELSRIQQHEAQWRQALDAPHTADQTKVLGENADWRKKFTNVYRTCEMFSEMIHREFPSGNKEVCQEVVRTGPKLLKALDDLNRIQQERLTEIEQCKTNWNEAIATRKGELAEIDDLVANRQPAIDAVKLATDAAKKETKDQQSKLQRVQSEVQCESTQLSSLSHLRMNAERALKETEEKAKKEEQSMNEARNSFNAQVEEHNRQIGERNAQLKEMEQGLRAREQRLIEEEQQFKTRCADTEQAHIQAEQKLEEDRTALQGETKKLQGDVSKAKRRWNLLCDYRDLKDSQVSHADEKADNLQELVARYEDDKKMLQQRVDDREFKLQEKRILLTSAKQSLDSMVKTKDDLVTQLNYQKSRLQAFASVQSKSEATNKENEQLKADKEGLSQKAAALEIQIKETQNGAATMQSLHGESMTSMNTLNNNVAKMLAAQTKQMLASFQENTVEKTKLISRVNDFQGRIIPGLKERLLVSEGELEKAKEDSNATIEGLRTESEDLREKLLSKEKELIECNTMGVLIASPPEDKAALEKCRAEHSDVDALRGRITQINREIYDLKAKRQEEETLMKTSNSQVLLLEAERNEALGDLSQAKEKLKRAEETIRSSEAQMNRCGQEHLELVADHKVLEQKHEDLQRLHIRDGESLREAHQSHQEQQDRLAIAERAKDAVQSESADLKRQVDSLTRQLHSTEAAVGNAQQTSHDYKNLLERYEHLRDRHETVQHLHEDAMRSLREANRSLQDRKRDLQTAQGRNEAIQTELDRSKVANVDLEQQITRLTEQLNIGNSNPRKRTHDQMSPLEPESHVGRVGDWGLFPDPALRDANTDSAPSSGQRPLLPRLGQQTSLTRGRPIGAPIDDLPIPQRHVYPVADVSAENFGDGRVPATVVDKLRSQVKAWNKKKPTWTGSDKRRCANSFAGKKTGDWKEKHGCDACADKGLICVAVCHDTIELLPLKDAGEISPSGEGYWFRRTDS